MYVMKRCGGVFIMKRCVLNVLCSHTCSHTFGFVGSLCCSQQQAFHWFLKSLRTFTDALFCISYNIFAL